MPVWLSHPLRWRSAPAPWSAMLRGALTAGPLLALGLLTGHLDQAVIAGIAAMLAGVNDRPGTRRTGAVHIGLPAVAGASGLLCGGLLMDAGIHWGAVPALFLVGLVSGALSVAGPVWSAAAMQLLVGTAIGAGMPLPGNAWLKAGCFVSGALWLLLLRVVLRPPGAARSKSGDGEREAVAGVFDALADALDAVGGPDADAAKRRLAAAQQRAGEALWLMRLLSLPVRRTGRLRSRTYMLTERFDAANALCRAAVALFWEGRPVPRRVLDGPRRLAAAVRGDGIPGPLAAPVGDSAGRASFDSALLAAAVTFDSTRPGRMPGGQRTPSTASTSWNARDALRRLRASTRLRRGVLGAAGREYGLRVALCVALSAAVALGLHESHWYWLPATAAFLVKPDMGPLFSRVVNRFAGTATGVLAFTAVTSVLGGAWWPVAVVAVGGGLIPLAARHFGFHTAVVTVLVLSFVHTLGDTEVALTRLTDTALACGIVLLVSHLPRLTDPRPHMGHRFAVALRYTERHLRHALGGPPADRDAASRGAALRQDAYRALAEARAVAETTEAELRGPYGGPRHDWLAVITKAERIADAATVCEVRAGHGAALPSAAELREVSAALAAVADAVEDGRGAAAVALPEVPPECRPLHEVMTELRGIRDLTTAAA